MQIPKPGQFLKKVKFLMPKLGQGFELNTLP